MVTKIFESIDVHFRLSYYYEHRGGGDQEKPMSQKSLDKLNIINQIFGYDPPRAGQGPEKLSTRYHNFALSEDPAHLNEEILTIAQNS